MQENCFQENVVTSNKPCYSSWPWLYHRQSLWSSILAQKISLIWRLFKNILSVSIWQEIEEGGDAIISYSVFSLVYILCFIVFSLMKILHVHTTQGMWSLFQVKWAIKIQCYLVNSENTLNFEIPIWRN